MSKRQWLASALIMALFSFLGGAAAWRLLPVQRAAAQIAVEPRFLEAAGLRIVEDGKVRAALDGEGLKFFGKDAGTSLLNARELWFTSENDTWRIRLGYVQKKPELAFYQRLIKRDEDEKETFPDEGPSPAVVQARLGFNLLDYPNQVENKLSLAFYGDEGKIRWSIPTE